MALALVDKLFLRITLGKHGYHNVELFTHAIIFLGDGLSVCLAHVRTPPSKVEYSTFRVAIYVNKRI